MRFIVQGTVKPPEQATERITPDKWAESRPAMIRAARNAAFFTAAGLAFVPVTVAADTLEAPSASPVAVFASPDYTVKGTCEPVQFEAAPESITADKWQGSDRAIQRLTRSPRAELHYLADGSGLVTVDQWLASQRNPDRPVRSTRDNTAGFTVDFPEAVSLDRWSAENSRPFRPLTSVRRSEAESIAQPEAVTPMEAVGAEISAVFAGGHWVVVSTKEPLQALQQQQEDVTLDKWRAAQHRIPALPRLYPHGEECPVFTEYLPNDAILDASHLVRLPYLTRTNYTIDAQALTQGETVTLDKWGTLPGEIRRRPLPGKASYDLLQTHFQAVPLDRWSGPSVEIRRKPRGGRATYGLTQAAFVEAVSIDRWIGPSAELRRQKLRGRTFYDFEKGGPTAEIVTFDKWEDRSQRRPRSKRLFFYPPSVLVRSAFAETVSLDRWASPDTKRIIAPTRRRDLSQLVSRVQEVLTLDKWESRIPQRIPSKKRSVAVSFDRDSAPRQEAVSVDRWLTQLARRLSVRFSRPAESAQALRIEELLSLDKWESRNGILVPVARRQRPEFSIDLSPRTELVSIDRFEGTSSRLARPLVQPVRSWITTSTVVPETVPDVAFNPSLGRVVRALLPVWRDLGVIDPRALTLAEELLLKWQPSHTHIPRGAKQPTRPWTTADTELFERLLTFAPMFFLDGEGRVTAVIDGSGRIISILDGSSHVSSVIED